ncbi:MATE family efflux transporter, partial [Blautia sp.]
MLASALYQVIDGILVGQILGELAFAALNLAMPFVIINFSLADLIGVGSAVPISVSLGKKETEHADNIFTCACIMIVGAGTLL